MLPDRDQRDRLFADDHPDEDEIFTLADYRSYAPVICCAFVMAFILTAIAQAVLFAIGAPIWIGRLLMLLYATLPFAALMIWAWDKPAVRLPSGQVLKRRQMRLYVGLGWAALTLLIVVRLLS